MKREIICGIYKITSPTNRVYIGESENIYKRWKDYKGVSCVKQPRIYNSILKYGVKNHKFEIIEICEPEERKCRERFWQDEFNVLGEEGLNCILTECGELGRDYSSSFYSRKGRNEVITFDGNVEYPSLREACKTLNLNFNEEYRRTADKLSLAKFYYKEEYFERRPSLISIVVSFDTDIEYPSLREACLQTGYIYEEQLYKIDRQYSNAMFYFKGRRFERKVPKNIRRAICFTTGQIYNSLGEGCKHRGLNYGKEQDYIRSKSKKATFYREGQYFERILEPQTIAVRSKIIGIEYNTLAEACREEEFSITAERYRLKANSPLSNLELNITYPDD